VEGVSDLPNAVVVIDCNASHGDAELHLLSVANRPVIMRVLDWLAEAGVRHVGLAVEPPLMPRMRRVLEPNHSWPFELSYLRCSSDGGLLDALRSASRWAAEGPLLLHWGCGVFKAPLRDHLGGRPIGPFDASVLVEAPSVEPPVVDIASERLAALTGHPRMKTSGGLAGVALLGSGAREAALKLEPGGGADLDLLAVVEKMTSLGGQVRALPAAMCWRHAGTADSALEVNRFLLSDLAPEPPGFESQATVLQGPAQIDASATLERSTVRGPAVIGPRARLFEAYIGPYTSIGADVCIEGAEIENSIVLRQTRISHPGRRLEASVIGPGATICRDFRLPSALRLHVGEGSRVSLT
jgi:glucose-1-phosphate thymidylyltransferase